MSVYAKKNSKGELTGQWVVEVTRDGKRHRETFGDIAEARRYEKSLLAGLVPSIATKAQAFADEAPRGFLVRDLKKQARVIWHATKDETQSLQRFDLAMELLGLDTPIAVIYTQQLDELVTALRARGLGDVTVHRYLCTVSAALRWACERHRTTGLQQMPVFPWKLLKKGEAKKVTLKPEDDDRVMEKLRAQGSHDIALVMDLLLSTGMRIGELTKLKPADFDRSTLSLTIGNWEGHTKNGDIRVVPLTAEMMDLGIALATVGWPSYRRVNSALHRVRKALGLTYVITPHTMRHTVVSRLSKAKVPIMTIMDLVGHKSMSTTKGYNHTDLETLTEATESLKR